MRAVGWPRDLAGVRAPSAPLKPPARRASVAFWIAGNSAPLLTRGLKSKYHVSVRWDDAMSSPAGDARKTSRQKYRGNGNLQKTGSAISVFERLQNAYSV